MGSMTFVSASVSVCIGLIVSMALWALWVVFAGAAAGNAGQTFSVATSVGLFAAYVLLALGLLLWRRLRAAVLVAWLPCFVVFGIWPVISLVAYLFRGS